MRRLLHFQLGAHTAPVQVGRRLRMAQGARISAQVMKSIMFLMEFTMASSRFVKTVIGPCVCHTAPTREGHCVVLTAAPSQLDETLT